MEERELLRYIPLHWEYTLTSPNTRTHSPFKGFSRGFTLITMALSCIFHQMADSLSGSCAGSSPSTGQFYPECAAQSG